MFYVKSIYAIVARYKTDFRVCKRSVVSESKDFEFSPEKKKPDPINK